MNKADLKQILLLHEEWGKDSQEGSRADLSGADLSGADLYEADLRRADLSGADLSGADLSGANLSGANLRRASLSGADLSGASLSGANLSGANLRRADLSGADLYEADLSGADLSGADLDYTIYPETGDFIAYKKAAGCVVKLLITGERTGGLVGRKCRCSKAKVLEIRNRKGHLQKRALGNYDQSTVYISGHEVLPDK